MAIASGRADFQSQGLFRGTLMSLRAVTKRRLIACVLLPLVVVLGLYCKRYAGPGREWVNNWGPASVAYEWLLMLLLFIALPYREFVNRIAVTIFVLTCVIEFLQLWHPDWLQTVRATWLGRMILGTTFNWWDFPAYVVGCVLGVFLLQAVCRFGDDSETAPPIRESGM